MAILAGTATPQQAADPETRFLVMLAAGVQLLAWMTMVDISCHSLTSMLDMSTVIACGKLHKLALKFDSPPTRGWLVSPSPP